MAQTIQTITLDNDLMQEFNKICNQLGMSITTAFNLFAKAVVRTKSIPFRIELGDRPTENPYKHLEILFNDMRADVANEPDLTLEEINAEIAAARAARQ